MQDSLKEEITGWFYPHQVQKVNFTTQEEVHHREDFEILWKRFQERGLY